MAKKKSFGVSKSLSVQPKQISPDEVEKAIQRIHKAEEVPAPPKKESPKPKPKANPVVKEPVAKKKAIVKEEPKKKVRLSVDVSPAIHKRLKIRAIENDSDIMRYVAMLIERDLNKK